jgi:hypothetical protein
VQKAFRQGFYWHSVVADAHDIVHHYPECAGNAQVQARLFATYREYKNFTHLPGGSIDAMFQRFTVIVNNMMANVAMLPYDGHGRAIKFRHSLNHTMWSEKVEAILESEKYETTSSL